MAGEVYEGCEEMAGDVGRCREVAGGGWRWREVAMACLRELPSGRGDDWLR